MSTQSSGTKAPSAPQVEIPRDVRTFEVVREIEVEAPIAVTFEAVLAEMGPEGEMPGGEAFPMVLEAWPGGRWFRDLGNNKGHLWGHVQVIKPPTLLEISGPMFMSYPAASHVQYRLTEVGKTTKVRLVHRAMGLIPAEHSEGVVMGWEHGLAHIRELAHRRVAVGR
ncbi:MAG TPA: SRPBCC domain-containing protein [Phycisphaerales bacterium]|nr:SRPBCC domain-containing protein [Phycisphaerales bacterium]